MRTDVITPAAPSHEDCKHHHAPVEMPLQRSESPTHGKVVIAELDGERVAGLVTGTEGDTHLTFYPTGPVIGRMPTRLQVKDETHILEAVKMLLIRPASAGAVEFEPVRSEHRHGAWWTLKPRWIATTDLDTAGRPTRSDQVTWHAFTELVGGELICQRVLMRQDTVREHREASPAKNGQTLCQVCTEELSRVAHHAMHRYTMPLAATFFSLETDDGRQMPGKDHPMGRTEMRRQTTSDRREILTGLLYRAVERGYVRQEPHIGATDAPTPEALLEVCDKSGKRIMNYHIPHQRALRWWKALLGIQ